MSARRARRHAPTPGPAPRRPTLTGTQGSETRLRKAFVTVHAKLDPGLRATARFAMETALCVAVSRDEIRKQMPLNGGLLTPSMLGMPLVERLKRSGIHFDVRLDENAASIR